MSSSSSFFQRLLAVSLVCWVAGPAIATVREEEAAGSGATAPVRLRELVGEHLRYRISWNGIPVGEATMEVRMGPLPWVVELHSTARSLPVLRWLYPVEDEIISQALIPDLTARRYHARTREGFRHREERVIEFDRVQNVAGTRIDGERRPWLAVPPGVRDPLSAIYTYRLADPGGATTVPITDGEKLILARMEFGAFETLETPAGSFETVVVRPRIEGLGGIFQRSPEAELTLWIGRDRWRRLVRMETAVAIGRVVVELTGIREPQGVPPPGQMARDWERWRPADPGD